MQRCVDAAQGRRNFLTEAICANALMLVQDGVRGEQEGNVPTRLSFFMLLCPRVHGGCGARIFSNKVRGLTSRLCALCGQDPYGNYVVQHVLGDHVIMVGRRIRSVPVRFTSQVSHQRFLQVGSPMEVHGHVLLPFFFFPPHPALPLLLLHVFLPRSLCLLSVSLLLFFFLSCSLELGVPRDHTKARRAHRRVLGIPVRERCLQQNQKHRPAHQRRQRLIVTRNMCPVQRDCCPRVAWAAFPLDLGPLFADTLCLASQLTTHDVRHHKAAPPNEVVASLIVDGSEPDSQFSPAACPRLQPFAPHARCQPRCAQKRAVWHKERAGQLCW